MIWVRVRVTGEVHITRVSGMGMLKKRDAHITVTPGLSRHGGPQDNEPVFKIRDEDNKQDFRLFSLYIYSLLLTSN